MSFVCLLANRNGAVVSSDTRITYNLLGKQLNLHYDHKQKVFRADRGRILWGAAGIAMSGISIVNLEVEKIFSRSDLSLDERILRIRRYICRISKQFYKMMLKKSDGIIHIVYASYIDPEAPIAGEIFALNGDITTDRTCPLPVYLQMGSNAAFLPPAEPLSDEMSIDELTEFAAERVRLAISYDKNRKAEDPGYNITVGGSIRSRSVSI